MLNMSANNTILHQYLNDEISLEKSYSRNELLALMKITTRFYNYYLQRHLVNLSTDPIYNKYKKKKDKLGYKFHNSTHESKMLDIGLDFNYISDDDIHEYIKECIDSASKLVGDLDITLHDIILDKFDSKFLVFKCGDEYLVNCKEVPFCPINNTYYAYTAQLKCKIYYGDYYLFDYNDGQSCEIRHVVFERDQYYMDRFCLNSIRWKYSNNEVMYRFSSNDEIQKAHKLYQCNPKLFRKTYKYCEYKSI